MRARKDRRQVSDPLYLNDRREYLRRAEDLNAQIAAATPTREQRIQVMRARLDACGAIYPGLYQPTACTLAVHSGDHVDERRSIRWPG
jgi:hypothetical protein